MKRISRSCASSNRTPENPPFIPQWTTEQHHDAIRRSDREHWIIESDDRGPLGYLIAYDLKSQDSGVYLKRIVGSHKGIGLGRAATTKFLEHAYRDGR